MTRAHRTPGRRIPTAVSAWRRAAAALLLCASAAADAATVYHGFTLLDPGAEVMIENAFIVVDGAHIARAGRGAPPAGAGFELVDMSGRYALPGFVDAHVTIGPRSIEMSGGAPVLKEAPTDEITRFNALIALSSGVTTIRNPAGVPDANARYAAMIGSGSWLGPDVLEAGTLFGGQPLNWALRPQTEEEWEQAIEREAQRGFELVKLYTGLSERELEQGIAAAHARGLRTIAHLDRVSWTRAALLGVDALSHALPTSEALLVEPARSEYVAMRSTPSGKYIYRWFELVDYDSQPMQEMIRVLAERQVVVDLTLVVNELVYWFDEADSSPPMQDPDVMAPALAKNWREQMSGSLYDWTADDYRRAKGVMPKVLELATRLYGAGVPLLIGTDSTGGGPFYARELELHVAAGIPVWEVLELATTKAAERLGLAERTGALAPGLEADVVFLEGNPLEDIGNVRQVDTVVVNGPRLSGSRAARAGTGRCSFALKRG